MGNIIQIKRKTTTGAPSVGDLSDGELCLVVPDETLYQRVNSSTLIQVNGGASSKEYASFYLSTGGLTSQAAIERTLVLNETHVNSNTSVFSLSSNQITINKDGDFKFSVDCYFNNSSTSRTEYSIWIEQNGTEVNGTRAGIYQRGYDIGQTSSINAILSVSSGDVIQIQVNRTSGTASNGYQDANGTRVTIEEK